MKKFLSWLFWPRPKPLELPKILLIFIILSNLLPIYGVLFLDWKYFPILMFYCIESIVGSTLDSPKTFQTDKNVNFALLSGIMGVTVMFICIWVPVITMVVVAASRIEHAVESVRNPYFITSAVILVLRIVIPWFKGYQKSKKNQKKYVNQMKPVEGALFIFKPYFLVGATFAIVITNFYTGALIILVIAKTFIDLRSFFRRQTSKDSSKSWLVVR
jgi:hypothetical protein